MLRCKTYSLVKDLNSSLLFCNGGNACHCNLGTQNPPLFACARTPQAFGSDNSEGEGGGEGGGGGGSSFEFNQPEIQIVNALAIRNLDQGGGGGGGGSCPGWTRRHVGIGFQPEIRIGNA